MVVNNPISYIEQAVETQIFRDIGVFNSTATRNYDISRRPNLSPPHSPRPLFSRDGNSLAVEWPFRSNEITFRPRKLNPANFPVQIRPCGCTSGETILKSKQNEFRAKGQFGHSSTPWGFMLPKNPEGGVTRRILRNFYSSYELLRRFVSENPPRDFDIRR